AARGEPAVPLVKISTANASASTSTTSVGDPDARRSKSTSASGPPASVATTVRTDGTAARSTPFHAVAAAGPTITTLAPTVATSCWISGEGLCGFNGTTTAPSPSTARYDATKYMLLPQSSATRSPALTPSSARPPRTLATSARNCPYVVSTPPEMIATWSSGWPSMMLARFTAVALTSEATR